MSFEHRGTLSLDYSPVVYPGSVLRFRGPRQRMEAPYVLCLGGSETFGRFIHAPFAAQLDAALPYDVVNMGVMNAGLDVLMHDPAIRTATQGAQAVVLQITGAQNMTNRFYGVHPRRNDRFIKATTMLRTLYPQVDFTDFHFVRHMLTHLKTLSADRFEVVEVELRTAWEARIAALLGQIPVPVHLLWLARQPPSVPEAGACAKSRCDADADGALGPDPLLITREMLERVAARAASLTIATPDTPAGGNSTRGMFFGGRDGLAARALPGPDAHDKAAQGLSSLLMASMPHRVQ